MLLILFEDDWADEMDICGFCVMTEKQWEYKKNETKHTTFPRKIYFGVNEYNAYETPEEYLKMFEVKEITRNQVEVIDELFGSDYYGKFPLMEGCASDGFYEKYGYYPEPQIR